MAKDRLKGWISPVAWTNRLAKAWRRSWQRNGASAQRAICAPMAVPLSGNRGLEVLVLVNLTSRRWIDALDHSATRPPGASRSQQGAG